MAIRAGVRRCGRSFALFAMIMVVAVSARAQDGIETEAAQVLLLDMATDTVLFEKDADTPFTPGSLAKLMTLEVLYEAIDAGEASLETTYPISEHAWRDGGAPSRNTTMFAELKSEVAVADLIRGIIVQTANDACIAVAEGLAGSGEAFTARMNARAAELGMRHSRFGNATGLPSAETAMSARDVARLAAHLIRAHPQRYAIFSETDFTWNKIFQRNRNPMFGEAGVDGSKAGFAKGAGHSMVVSAVRDGRRLLLVIGGLDSERARDAEAAALLRAGFETYRAVQLFDAGETVAEARVFGGAQGNVSLVSYVPIEMTMAPAQHQLYRMRVVYTGPVPAPVSKGQRVGALHLYRDKQLVHASPLFAASDVGVGRLDQRALDSAAELLFGWW